MERVKEYGGLSDKIVRQITRSLVNIYLRKKTSSKEDAEDSCLNKKSQSLAPVHRPE